MGDFLDRLAKKRTRKNPAFPQLVAEARERNRWQRQEERVAEMQRLLAEMRKPRVNVRKQCALAEQINELARQLLEDVPTDLRTGL